MVCTFSAHILPGLCLIGLVYVGHHPYWCVAVITISLGLNGASTLTNLQNSQVGPSSEFGNMKRIK